MKSNEGVGAASFSKASLDEPKRRSPDRRVAAALEARARRAPAADSRVSDEPDQRLRQQILTRLKALGMTARQASLQAGLSPDCVKEIVAGRRRPRPATLSRLGRVLGCDLDF